MNWVGIEGTCIARADKHLRHLRGELMEGICQMIRHRFEFLQRSEVFEVRQVAAAVKEAGQAKVGDEAVKETTQVKANMVLLEECRHPPAVRPPLMVLVVAPRPCLLQVCRPSRVPQRVLALVSLACFWRKGVRIGCTRR